MLTRLEIHGFKTFENFKLDLHPFSAIVGPNASGKSNLFDALKFLSLLAQYDVRTAMQDLRGEPEELFRLTSNGIAQEMRFAVEVILEKSGADAFQKYYEIKAQRLRYELYLRTRLDSRGQARGITVAYEACYPLLKGNDKASFLNRAKLNYPARVNPFITTRLNGDEPTAFEIRQDGPSKGGATRRGRPMTLSALEASRSALSTIATAEFPHLYALRDFLTSMRFLEINPQAARRPNSRFEVGMLKPNASNLAAVLARLREETRTDLRHEGAISDISTDLATLIPSVRAVRILDSPDMKEFSFGIETADRLSFSSRVISDGTLRVLALLAILDDPGRRGVLCFEEPENGVHEGRIPALVNLLRQSVPASDDIAQDKLFQILINTHSPAVLASLQVDEVVAADTVDVIDPATKTKYVKTRMRRLHDEMQQTDFNWERDITRQEVDDLLRSPGNNV